MSVSEITLLTQKHEALGDEYLARVRALRLPVHAVEWHSPQGLRGPVRAFLYYDFPHSDAGHYIDAPPGCLVFAVIDAIRAFHVGAGRN